MPGEIMQQEWALFQQAYRIKNDERRSGGAFIFGSDCRDAETVL
jgi:hypothetical protein